MPAPLITCVLSGFAIALAAAVAAETGAPPSASPVRDLDEPLPAYADPRDPGAARERACAIFAQAKGDRTRIREAYESMRTAARLGDPDANLYLAKFLRTGFHGRQNLAAANARIGDRLARDVEGAINSSDRVARINQVYEMLGTETCGPAIDLNKGDVFALAPPPGLLAVPRPRSLADGPGGFAGVVPSPEADSYAHAAAALGLASKARARACGIYRGASGDPARLQEAYITMRTAADCGDEPARMYVSAYLRAGIGTQQNTDLANWFLRRAITYAGRHRETLDPIPLGEGEFSPPDIYGARKISELHLDPMK